MKYVKRIKPWLGLLMMLALGSAPTLASAKPLDQAALQALLAKTPRVALNGWVPMDGPRADVTPGLVRAHGGSGWLRSDKTYRNFVLSVRVRSARTGQGGGIFLRASADATGINRWPSEYVEVQTRSDDNIAIINEANVEWDPKLARAQLLGAGEWNEFELRVFGEHLDVRLNGELVSRSDSLVRRTGHIGIKVEAGEVEYEVRIQVLPDDLQGDFQRLQAEQDPDFGLQGEYLHGNSGLGAQVIGLGAGEFKARLMNGGLPGEGYSGKIAATLAGQRAADGTVLLTGDGRTALLSNGRFQLEGGPVLERVERDYLARTTPPPPGALVLFDGHNVDEWQDAIVGADGFFVVSGEYLAKTVKSLSSGHYHVEFREPWGPLQRGLQRGNCGFYITGRYETQILDNFGYEGASELLGVQHPLADGGSIDATRAPDINMVLPPLVWQSYDIDLIAARFDANGRRIAKAMTTIWHNGVLVHDHITLDGPTGVVTRLMMEVAEAPLTISGSLYMSPTLRGAVRLRNIWFLPRGPSCTEDSADSLPFKCPGTDPDPNPNGSDSGAPSGPDAGGHGGDGTANGGDGKDDGGDGSHGGVSPPDDVGVPGPKPRRGCSMSASGPEHPMLGSSAMSLLLLTVVGACLRKRRRRI